MKTQTSSSFSSDRHGSSIALILILTASLGLVVAAALQHATTESRLNQSAFVHNQARLAAESAIQHGMAQLRDRFSRSHQLRENDLLPGSSPLVLASSFKALHSDGRVLLPSDQVYDASKFATYPTAVLGEVVNQNPINVLVDPLSPVPDQNAATVDALVREVRLYAKATSEHPQLGSRTAYVSKTFQILDLSLFQYAVFYNHDLELWPGANMSLGEGGPIHVNGDAFIGANNRLEIHSRFTTSGNFYVRRHPEYNGGRPSTSNIYLRDMHGGSNPADYLVRLVDASEADGGSYLSSEASEFNDLARRHFNGGLLTKEHNVDTVHPAGLDGFMALFPPGAGEDGNHAYNLIRPVENPDSVPLTGLSEQKRAAIKTIEELKWSNKAKLTLELNMDGAAPKVDVYTYDYNADGKIAFTADEPVRTTINVPAGKEFWTVEEFSKSGATVTSGLYDRRQGHNTANHSDGEINLLRLDVAKMREWVESSDGAVFDPHWWNGVVYVKMPEVVGVEREDRVVPANPNWATQLENGTRIPNRPSSGARGMTLATNGALYVTGDYNAPQGGTSPSASPNPNSFGDAGYEAPAALVADAVTILSNSWDSANSHKGLGNRIASDTIVSAALVTGLVPSEDGDYSGGVENFPRFLEKWSNKTLTYRGSMVSLFESESQDAPWPGTGTTYDPPIRNWGFHTGFRELPPPGDPGGRVYRQISFKELSREEFEAATNEILGSVPES